MIVALAALLVGLLAACGADDGDVIDVFAAASLTDAFTELGAEFEAANPGIDVRLNFAGTSTLREQLLDGAEADVFASANMAIMDQLVADGEVRGQPQVIAQNVLVLAVPTDNPGGVNDLPDLSRPELFVGICAEGVPCGDLARRFLDVHGIAAQVDTAEPDVRSLARRLADRELDVALIYASDVAADPERLRTVPLDQMRYGHPGTLYPMAAIDADDPDAAAFIDFVVGPVGRRVLEQSGFAAP